MLVVYHKLYAGLILQDIENIPQSWDMWVLQQNLIILELYNTHIYITRILILFNKDKYNCC